MNKRKINNYDIQTSKRPDADIGKDEVMGRDAAIGTWNVDTDMGKEDKDRTIGDDNSGTTIPLGAFPKKIQEMAKVLVEYENYNQDYLLVSMLSAVATAEQSHPVRHPCRTTRRRQDTATGLCLQAH